MNNWHFLHHEQNEGFYMVGKACFCLLFFSGKLDVGIAIE
jgi:hypothetical protein